MTQVSNIQVPAGLSVQTQQKARVPRRPQHPFAVSHRPYEIQPFLIAPVLPGESLENVLLQSRAITDPIRNPITGWWLEYYLFYVPLRQTDGGYLSHGSSTDRTEVENMLLDISQPKPNDNTALSYQYSSASGTGVNWVDMCLRAVVQNYFRDEGEDYNGTFYDFTTGVSPPLAKIVQKNFTDSMYPASAVADQTIDQTPTADISIEDLDGKYTMWQILRAQKMTEMSFDDYLNTFGVKTSKAAGASIELIRQIKSWSYPSNTINPANIYDTSDPPEVVQAAGSPTSAVSWGIKESADKVRFYKEPGFLFGVTIARPKLYISTNLQVSNASSMLRGALDWMPALMKERVELSVKKYLTGEGPIPDAAWSGGGYWLDVRDLFIYGDQFVTPNSSYRIPTYGDRTPHLPTLTEFNAAKTYPTSDEVNQLFVAETGSVHQDGVVHLNIMGTQLDYT